MIQSSFNPYLYFEQIWMLVSTLFKILIVTNMENTKLCTWRMLNYQQYPDRYPNIQVYVSMYIVYLSESI